MPISFGMLLNLAAVVNADEASVLWGFITRYADGATPENNPALDKLVGYAVSYYRDFVKPNKQYRLPNEQETTAMTQLVTKLRALDGSAEAGDIQTIVFEVGKENEFENLRDWFKALYETLLGQSQGPRMGSFISLYGVTETVSLIDRVLAGEDLGAS